MTRAMFFDLSKLLAVFVAPGNLLLIALAVGAVLLWTRARRAGRTLVTLGVAGFLLIALVPVFAIRLVGGAIMLGYAALEYYRFSEEEREVDGDDEHADEVAWKTAVDSAPWLLGSTPPEREVPPEELFEKLQPFKELVAEDIKDGERED